MGVILRRVGRAAWGDVLYRVGEMAVLYLVPILLLLVVATWWRPERVGDDLTAFLLVPMSLFVITIRIWLRPALPPIPTPLGADAARPELVQVAALAGLLGLMLGFAFIVSIPIYAALGLMWAVHDGLVFGGFLFGISALWTVACLGVIVSRHPMVRAAARTPGASRRLVVAVGTAVMVVIVVWLTPKQRL